MTPDSMTPPLLRIRSSDLSSIADLNNFEDVFKMVERYLYQSLPLMKENDMRLLNLNEEEEEM